MAREQKVVDYDLQAVELAAGTLQVKLDGTCQGRVLLDGKLVRDVRRLSIEIKPGRAPKVRVEQLKQPG